MRPFTVKVAENARIFAMTPGQTGLERVDCLAIEHPFDSFSLEPQAAVQLSKLN
jgi:hypothetical protein